MNTIRITVLLSCIVCFTACSAQKNREKTFTQVKNNFNEQFKQYWFEGKAEVTSYELKQARYGEIRDGEAILVFVTEDFLLERQVKKESNTSEKATSVLKLNFIRKFPTGIYDYTMMTSTFTPIHLKNLYSPLKLTSSSTEWCGQSWLQLNRIAQSTYKALSYSYFESEGDEEKEVSDVLLEDGIWAQIRMNPNLIKEGEQSILPSAHYLRFAHKEIKAYKGIIEKNENKDERFKGEKLQVLTISYPELNRKLEIVYEGAFPYKIIGWKERRNSWKQNLETFAIVKAEKKSAYWGENSKADAPLREELKLK